MSRTLGAIALLLVVASIGGQLAKVALGPDRFRGLILLFNLNGEGNVPTFFSVLLMASAALVLAIIATARGRHGDRHAAKWWALSAGFLAMGYDEAFRVHERLTAPMQALLGGSGLGLFHFAWVVPGIALVAMLGLYFLKFLRDLPPSTRWEVVTAAALYLGGAIGVELAGGGYASVNGEEGVVFNLLATVEEGMEMAGIIVFIRALLTYVGGQHGEVRFRLQIDQAPRVTTSP